VTGNLPSATASTRVENSSPNKDSSPNKEFFDTNGEVHGSPGGDVRDKELRREELRIEELRALEERLEVLTQALTQKIEELRQLTQSNGQLTQSNEASATQIEQLNGHLGFLKENETP